MALSELKTEADYTAAVSSPCLTAVHFLASWAPECATVTAVLQELAREEQLQGKAVFYELSAEDLAEVSMKHEIQAVPTVLLFRAGKAVDRVDGVNAVELTKKVRSHAQAGPPTLPQAPKEDLNTKLKRLISAHKCMLFMKGNPEEPKCGFSKTTIGLLTDLEADYGTFDILTDDEVRQGLKEFSKWPTYPQLYVDGELVGGLDILKELLESGELKEMLPTKVSLDKRLSSLTHSSPVMVFMKGNPAEPKCGFSKQLMGILEDTKVPFSTFDILTDEEVRQGLKKFSNWPTFPQVYVSGELVGGLDIIKELLEAGDLVDTLKGEA